MAHPMGLSHNFEVMEFQAVHSPGVDVPAALELEP